MTTDAQQSTAQRLRGRRRVAGRRASNDGDCTAVDGPAAARSTAGAQVPASPPQMTTDAQQSTAQRDGGGVAGYDFRCCMSGPLSGAFPSASGGEARAREQEGPQHSAGTEERRRVARARISCSAHVSSPSLQGRSHPAVGPAVLAEPVLPAAGDECNSSRPRCARRPYGRSLARGGGIGER